MCRDEDMTRALGREEGRKEGRQASILGIKCDVRQRKIKRTV